jgi:hypothetical protein
MKMLPGGNAAPSGKDRERKTPSVGILPANIPACKQTLVVGTDVAVSVSNIQATREGIFLILDAMFRENVSLDVKFGLEGAPIGDARDGLRVWLSHSGRNVYSESISGGGGRRPDDIGRWAFRLWFPVDVESLADDVFVHVLWEDLDLELRILAEDVKGGASAALAWV